MLLFQKPSLEFAPRDDPPYFLELFLSQIPAVSYDCTTVHLNQEMVCANQACITPDKPQKNVICKDSPLTVL